ncbi:MAG: hypothetical protein HGB33_03925, partial [Syntrophaceae bacterium]|nr:hypothetical protein [Syntrophaceae bacterium]
IPGMAGVAKSVKQAFGAAMTADTGGGNVALDALLGIKAAREALARAGVPGSDIGSVITGNAYRLAG